MYSTGRRAGSARWRWMAAVASGAVLAGAAGAWPALARAQCAPSAVEPGAPTALVLSGGGAKGAYEAGVAAGLAGAGVRLALVAGSSAGALNAALVADGRLDRLDAHWRGLSRERVYRLRPGAAAAGLLPGWLAVLGWRATSSLLDPSPLRELIETSLDLDRVRASPVRIAVVATELRHRRPRVFDNASVTVDALMAASAVPGLFPPVRIAGETLVDGGLVARAPVVEALGQGVAVSRALVVLSYAPMGEAAAPERAGGAVEEAFEASMVAQIRRDVALARLAYPQVEIQVLEPSAPLALRPLDFDPASLARAIDQGRADALTCAQTWRSPR